MMCPRAGDPASHVTSQLYRYRLTKPREVPPKQRVVPAFSLQSLQANTVVKRAPRGGARRPRPVTTPTHFQMLYRRGDLPVVVHINTLSWTVDLEGLDYHHFLPLFFEGLRETSHPYRFIALHGLGDLLNNDGDRILPCVPQLIVPLRCALDSRDRRVIATTLLALQLLVKTDPRVGESLVPYYRQLLPACNLFWQDRLTHSREIPLGTIIQDTLNLLEMHGGVDAYVNIKYMVPSYQSCIFY